MALTVGIIIMEQFWGQLPPPATMSVTLRAMFLLNLNGCILLRTEDVCIIIVTESPINDEVQTF